MKTSRVLLMVSAVAVGVPVAAMAQGKGKPAAPAAKPNKQVQRGEYLVKIGGCNDCHTPLAMGPNGPAPDMTKMLTGHPEGMQLPPPPAPVGPWIVSFAATNTAISGPWGISYAANLTPDKDTGLGNWTEEQFIDSMKTGKHLGQGRPILPPMPWFNVAAMTPDDQKAVWAYLKSLAPAKNKVPAPTPPAAAAPAAPAGGPATPPAGGAATPPGGKK